MGLDQGNVLRFHQIYLSLDSCIVELDFWKHLPEPREILTVYTYVTAV